MNIHTYIHKYSILYMSLDKDEKKRLIKLANETEMRNQEGIFRELYDTGIITFNKAFSNPATINETNGTTNKPNIAPITFEEWYPKLFNDIYEGYPYLEEVPNGKTLKTNRFNKIIQYGNFGVSQPTGGFKLKTYIAKDDMRNKYVSVLRDLTEPALMVITEPFKSNFFGEMVGDSVGVFYKIIRLEDKDRKLIPGTKECGVLYNRLFDEKYSIDADELSETIIGSTVIKLVEKTPVLGGSYIGRLFKQRGKTASMRNKETEKKQMENLTRAILLKERLNKERSNKPINQVSNNTTVVPSPKPIVIVNFHGDSKGGKSGLDAFENFIRDTTRLGLILFQEIQT